jgi:tRNA(Ile)-lysidine synthase
VPVGVSPEALKARVLALLGTQSLERRLAIGVSGGSDSMALLRLAAQAFPGQVTALTVDHALRTESAAEAVQVAQWCAAIDVPHITLHWAGEKPATGLQAAAREARYRLMTAWCAAHAAVLATAHTADDQAETLLMRLARGSGLAGLSGVRACTAFDDVPIVRPLLEIERAALRSRLEDIGQPWIDDPSNDDTRFERVRMRQWLAYSAPLGLSAPALAQSAAHLQALDSWLDGLVAAAFAAQAKLDRFGVLTLPRTWPGLDTPEALRRLRNRALSLASGQPTNITDFSSWDGPSFTLGGCVVSHMGDTTRLVREAGRITHRLPSPLDDTLWDGRFLVNSAHEGEIACLGEVGWYQIVTDKPALAGHPCPYPARLALPALWQAGHVLAVDALDYSRNDASLRSSLALRAPQRLSDPLEGLS